MPYTQTIHYLGTRYEVTRANDSYGELLWRTIRISRGDVTTGPLLSDLDLLGQWESFRPTAYYRRQEEFLQYLRCTVTNPGEVDDLAFCQNCAEPVWAEDTDSGICEPCRDQYYAYCDDCSDLAHQDSLNGTLHESYICDRCLSRYYTYCDDCDGYYNDSYSEEHQHYSDDGCCESPQMQFTVRNDGADPLPNDTRASFTLPAGHISEAGMRAIIRYLRTQEPYELSYHVWEIGDQWQTKEGNFAKRLSRFAYKRFQAKITPEVMSQVGCIARDHSNAVAVEIETTRDFNQPPEYFYHEESCYWGGYSESRCVLKTNGAFAIRSFKDGQLSGRVWVMPLRLEPNGAFAPTFNTLDPDAFVVFNGYGDLSGYAPARIMSHMAGCTYKKIEFAVGEAYINSGGYLVAPEHIAQNYDGQTIYLRVSSHSDLYEREIQS